MVVRLPVTELRKIVLQVPVTILLVVTGEYDTLNANLSQGPLVLRIRLSVRLFCMMHPVVRGTRPQPVGPEKPVLQHKRYEVH